MAAAGGGGGARAEPDGASIGQARIQATLQDPCTAIAKRRLAQKSMRLHACSLWWMRRCASS